MKFTPYFRPYGVRINIIDLLVYPGILSGYGGRFIRNISMGGLSSVMASGILSISAYHHHFYDLSSLLYVVSIFLLVLICIPSFWITRDLIWRNTDYRWKFNRFTFISGISVIITRTLMVTQSIPVSYLSLMVVYAAIISSLIFTLKEIAGRKLVADDAHFSQLNIGVAVASSSVAFTFGVPLIKPIPAVISLYTAVFAVLLSLILYSLFVALNIEKFLKGRYNINNIDGSLWISMGLLALISVSFYSLIGIGGAESPLQVKWIYDISFWLWVLATAALVPVAVLSLNRLRKSLNFNYHPSLWAVVFPTGVYSLDTTIISVHLSSHFLYGYSVIIDILSSSLFFLFIVLLIIFSKN